MCIPGIIVTEMSTKSVNMAEDPEAARAGNVWDDGEFRYRVLNLRTNFSTKARADFRQVNLPGHFSVWLASKEGHATPSGRYLWAHWDVEELKERSKELYDDPVALTLTLSGWPFSMPEVENT